MGADSQLDEIKCRWFLVCNREAGEGLLSILSRTKRNAANAAGLRTFAQSSRGGLLTLNIPLGFVNRLSTSRVDMSHESAKNPALPAAPFVDITNVSLEPCANSKFIPTARMRYTIGGKQRTWDCVLAHDGVAVLLYHVDKRAFVLVRQFRPAGSSLWHTPSTYAQILPRYSRLFPIHECRAVFLSLLRAANALGADATCDPNSVDRAGAFTTELCAGIVDKSKSLEEIACEEVLEECGYNVRPQGA